MMTNFDDIQKLGKDNMDRALKVFDEWQKGWQEIAVEMTNYSQRSFQDGTTTVDKLMRAKSLDQAFQIQTDYAKRAYDDYMEEMKKLQVMYAGFAKEAFRPVERYMQQGR